MPFTTTHTLIAYIWDYLPLLIQAFKMGTGQERMRSNQTQTTYHVMGFKLRSLLWEASSLSTLPRLLSDKVHVVLSLVLALSRYVE